jgi:predicted HicB family RNase H-like nuclease
MSVTIRTVRRADPKTLHFALEREAAQAGVSLNQLVVAKLAFSLGQATQKRGA